MFGIAADISLRILAAAAAVGLVLVVLRVRSGAARHAAWSAVLLAMLTMPLLMAIVPRVDVPVPSTLALDFGAIAGEDPLAVPWEDALGVPMATESRGVEATPPPLQSDSRPVSGAWSGETSLRRMASAVSPLLVPVYVAGLFFFAVRLTAGWYVARRLVGGATRADVENRAPVYESAAIATPLTTGVFSPSVLLPLAWRAWPADKLAAVLAHENAHIARRDALVAFLAHANRAIFWFHPLAWWLERTLAVTAEHACDETAAREVGQPRRYAEVLLDMAEAVRVRGHRVSWQAIGVDGSGLLGTRIDRLLKGDAMARMSGVQRAAVAVGCAAVLVLAIACRQQIAAEPLRPDPEVARRFAEQDARTKRFEAARDMTPEQADVLEARIERDANDWDAREQLVTYYRAGRAVPWDRKVPGLRRHALWLIEHHPEHAITPPPLSPQYDPDGFAAAARLWEAHLKRPDASPSLVYRAARFFTPYDKPRAEQLILRGMSMDPQSESFKAQEPPGAGWAWQLASLYGLALTGVESAFSPRPDPQKARSPFALEVRKKLAESQDAVLLARVGGYLLSRSSPATTGTDPELRSLGRQYVNGALELQPDLESARTTLRRLDQQERHARLWEAVTKGGSVSDEDRLAFLAERAQYNYMIGEARWTLTAGKDRAALDERRKAAIRDAKAAAEEALQVAAQTPDHPDFSTTVMTAHQTLGLLALREGDRKAAVKHMEESVKVPPVSDISYRSDMVGTRLATYLLKEGERESVVRFLEAFARISPGERDRVLEDAAAIRAGRMPRSYQTMFARP